MARSIEVDWVLVRVHTVRRAAVLAAIGVVATLLVIIAYMRLNQPPEAVARNAIEAAESAHERVAAQPVADIWRKELTQAESQLETARAAYAQEAWQDAIRQASDARSRFEALLGASKHQLVGVGEFFSLEGRVTVQRAGKPEWSAAHQRMPVFNGDFVKTGRDGSAEILFADGSLYRIAPNSLLEIHQRRQADRERGTVKMLVGRINVYTSGSPSTVTTESTETEVERDSRVAVDVAEGSKETTVAAFQGSARMRNPSGQEMVVGSREQLSTTADGVFTEKRRMPNPPIPIEPLNNAGFEMADGLVIELRWRRSAEDTAVHLQVSRSKGFVEGQMDVDAGRINRDRARLRAVAPGTYYWRVASVIGDSLRSEWSSVRRFQIFSTTRKVLLEDRDPPPLELNPTHQLGHMVIVEGRTEPGATVTVNGEAVEPDGEGHFRKAIELGTPGWNELLVSAVDPSGNRSEHRERVFVESF